MLKGRPARRGPGNCQEFWDCFGHLRTAPRVELKLAEACMAGGCMLLPHLILSKREITAVFCADRTFWRHHRLGLTYWPAKAFLYCRLILKPWPRMDVLSIGEAMETQWSDGIRYIIWLTREAILATFWAITVGIESSYRVRQNLLCPTSDHKCAPAISGTC